MDRIERHNGQLILVSSAEHLTPKERSEVPEQLLCADLESGTAHWTGMEWTGEPDVGYPSWRAVMHFVLWRMLDGGFVRPPDLDMLFAAHR